MVGEPVVIAEPSFLEGELSPAVLERFVSQSRNGLRGDLLEADLWPGITSVLPVIRSQSERARASVTRLHPYPAAPVIIFLRSRPEESQMKLRQVFLSAFAAMAVLLAASSTVLGFKVVSPFFA